MPYNEKSRLNLRPAPPWRRGQSGNPSGSTYERRLTKELRELLMDDETRAQFLDTMIRKAIEGDFAFHRAVFDRADGPVAQVVETQADITVREALAERFRAVVDAANADARGGSGGIGSLPEPARALQPDDPGTGSVLVSPAADSGVGGEVSGDAGADREHDREDVRGGGDHP